MTSRAARVTPRSTALTGWRDVSYPTLDLFSEPGDRHRRVQDAEVGFHAHDPSDTQLGSALALVKTSGAKKGRLLTALVEAGWRGLTDHEAVVAARLPMSSVNSIRNKLVDRDWVEDSGRRRMSPFKRPVAVWVATIAGRRQVK